MAKLSFPKTHVPEPTEGSHSHARVYTPYLTTRHVMPSLSDWWDRQPGRSSLIGRKGNTPLMCLRVNNIPLRAALNANKLP